MLKKTLLPALALVALGSMAEAQQRPPQREDLLDAITRHISLCTEIPDGTARLACYDRLQTRLGDVQPTTTPQPTPLRPGTQPATTTPTTPPLMTPGGGVATLGPGPGTGPNTLPNVQAGPSPLGQPQDPDRAFDPTRSTYRPPETIGAKPQPQVRRTGPRPIPPFSRPMSLVTLDANNLTYGEARYWQVSIAITSNTPRTLDTQIQCTFTNAGKPVEEVFFGPIAIQPGEQINTELIGPPTTAYVDSSHCKVLSP
jgi:hypothetical protein